MIVHAVSTFVLAAVIPVNVFAAPEFAWSAIAVACMVCGLAIHYLFGVRWLQRSVQAHQDKVERYAWQPRDAATLDFGRRGCLRALTAASPSRAP